MSEYVELHCHSNFSLLDGASPPEDLVARAAQLGMPALALTDHDAVYGALRFAQTATAVGVKPIFGAELTLDDSAHLTLLARNKTGWRNLCTLITLAQHNAPKGEAALPFGALEGRTEGLIALSGCRQGAVTAALLRHDVDGALAAARHVRDLFGPENTWIELQHHLLPDDNHLIRELVALARELGLGYVATNDVHYAQRESQRLQDVLVCIRHNVAYDEASHLCRPGSEYYLKPGWRLAPLFRHAPGALDNTLHIAERCGFELQYGLQELPAFPTPEGKSTQTFLRDLCTTALLRRYPNTSAEVQTRLEYELRVIAKGGLSNYFLIVWDIMRYAREQGIRCQGRGSAANSLVAYLLGITPIDPLKHNLVFERFLSSERVIAPDIDIDFDAARREEVIQYVYQRYGADHTAMACTFITFRARSAFRDVGKALGLPVALVDRAAKALDVHDAREIGSAPDMEAIWDDSEVWTQVHDLCGQIAGFPRHLGIHNGGMIITGAPLGERIPIEPATMPDRAVVQWDKESLEAAGLVKIDILGLRMLSAISEALELIEESAGERIDLDELSFDDPAVYDLISRADTVGVYQVESRAQAQMLPRFQPRRFKDLIVAISLIRPGPLQGNMVHPYLRRRLGEEPVRYLHPLLKPALEETLGVILYQEQVLKVARDLAGFTAGQGEVLRRALGSKNATKHIDTLRDEFIRGAQAKGVSTEVAEEAFESLRAFGGYSFPKAHASAFAVIVYQSAWLKRYYPIPFYAGILNNQPMGFWSPAVVLNDAKHHGVRILPVDVNASRGGASVEGDALRLGLASVKGMGEIGIERIKATRSERRFTNLADLCRRTCLPRRLVENLILAGALDAFGTNRRQLLWQLRNLHYAEDELDLVFSDSDVEFSPMTQMEQFGYEYGMLGLSAAEHPISFCRAWLDENHVLDSRALADSQVSEIVRVGGLIVMHQAPPTAKGHHFITLEDEHGLLDIVIRPRVYEHYRRVIRGSSVIVVKGSVQRSKGVTNIIAKHISGVS